MLSIDVNAFCNAYFAADASLSPAAKAGLDFLVQSLASDPDISDPRWAAYMLATVQHECGDQYQPVEERGHGAGKPYGVPVQVTAPDGTVFTNTYYGRGYVQLTWKANYDVVGRDILVGNLLLLHPEHALEPYTAYKVMSYGMRHGSFTGVGLARFIGGDRCDYFNARRIINALDQADRIAGYAANFEKLLNQSKAAAAGVSA
jgi:predicted chitinase